MTSFFSPQQVQIKGATVQIDKDQNAVHECDVCGKIFVTKISITKHVKTHAQFKPEISLSHKSSLKSNTNLERHDKKSKTRRKIKKLQMDHKQVPKALKSRLKKRSQVRIEERNFHCETCQKSFKSNYYLNEHSLVHTNIRKFECQQCGKKFKRKSDLKVHMVTHSEERNYNCSKCGAAFKTNKDRSKHQRRICKLISKRK
jgi:KRAB domain-containing zinc finger protein